MWAHHPSAWTGSPRAPSENVNNINTRKRSMSKRRKSVIDGTTKHLKTDEFREYYVQFASKWYENRDEVIIKFYHKI